MQVRFLGSLLAQLCHDGFAAFHVMCNLKVLELLGVGITIDHRKLTPQI